MQGWRGLLSTALVALGVATPASAITFTVTSTPYTAAAPTGYVAMCGVTDPACRNRWTGNYIITNFDLVNRHLVPAGWTGEFAAVPDPLNPGGNATLSFAGIGPINSWMMLWGSAGRGNRLELSYVGSNTPYVVNMSDVLLNTAGETTTQRINRWVTITSDVAFTPTSARFSHPSFAFEATSFGIKPATTGFIGGVPEPASWGMMIAGFGLTGAALRRRRALTA
jgi:hypothetical protein